MQRILIIAQETLAARLSSDLGRLGYASVVFRQADDLRSLAADAVLASLENNPAEDLCRRLKTERELPVIALVSERWSTTNCKRCPAMILLLSLMTPPS
jgi:hypothetical protein